MGQDILDTDVLLIKNFIDLYINSNLESFINKINSSNNFQHLFI